ncbi:uncharacterized protein LOC123561061 isoform X2 [Mercenaria mercenaria]|nr:uncharacterized protein LOC123561061 isoform X2 [Mercenaria mercenaria]
MSDIRSPIPVVDVDKIGMHRKSDEIDKASLEAVALSLKNSFCKYGVCYFKNHGIEYEDKFIHISEAFFKQPLDVKTQHLRGTRRDFGYSPVGQEKANLENPVDLKESFNYQPGDDQDDWMDNAFPDACKEMFGQCSVFGYRVLDALSLALGQRQTFLRDSSARIGTQDNPTTLRSLYYPPIPLDMTTKPGEIRFPEHSDYGTISFLFQDEVGGLEVDFPGKGFVEVIPIPGTILVIAADLLQRWTADAVVSTPHRVLIPAEESKKRKPRQSAVFFILPDNDYVVKPLDGSTKYKPITCMEYLRPKMTQLVGVTY